jgi:hypothetical protein
VAKKSTTKNELKIEYLVIDPSFFVKPEKLNIISKLEKSIAEFELIKQSQTGTEHVRHGMKLSMDSESPTSTSSSGSGGDHSASFSEEELSKHKPKIILPNTLRVIDPLRIRAENLTVQQLAEDHVLRDILRHWGLKKEIIRNEKAYLEFIHQLKSSRLIDKFFDERRERITWLDDPRAGEKIGENSIFELDITKMCGQIVSKTLFPMYKFCRNKPNSCIVVCNNSFRRLSKKIGITKINLFTSGSAASISTARICHFGLDLEPAAFLQTLGIAPDLIGTVIDTAVAASIGFPVLSLVTNTTKIANTVKNRKKKAKEEFIRRCKDDGQIVESDWRFNSTRPTDWE